MFIKKKKKGFIQHLKFSACIFKNKWCRINNFHFKRSKGNSLSAGFTIIEALVTLFVFSLITVTFYSTFAIGTNYILESKNRNLATSLANERMEIIRNLNYDDIGTIGGIPSGDLDADEYVNSGGKSFRVKTEIYYQDDSFDGIGSEDRNGVVTDYKIVKAMVLWGNEGVGKRVEFVSRFVPAGVEIGNPDEGTLVVNVLSQDGPVSRVNVHIQNGYVSPGVNLNRETDDNGQVYIPGAKESIQTYKITVSKSGYETVETFDPDAPEMTYVPYDKNGSVIASSINISNITINKLANLKFISKDASENSLAGARFSVSGGRQLDEIGAVFNFNENNQVTGANGEKEFLNISPGDFSFSIGENPDGFEYIGMGIKALFKLQPNEAREIVLKFAPKNQVWLRVEVKNEGDEFIEGASVKLSNATGFNQEKITTEDGVAFFWDEVNLLSGEYELEISKEGYVAKNESLSLVEESKKEVKLSIEE